MATTDPTDEALLRRIADQDEGALAALYDRYAAVSLAVAMKIVGDRAEAEDVLQNVYVRVWKDASRFDPGRGSVTAWLLSSVRNAAIDRTRRRDAYLRATKAAPIRIADEPEPVELREDQKRVSAALLQLPQDQREALELAYFKGLTQTEVSQKLGQPLGTVKTRMRLGMMRLRKALLEGKP